MSLSDRMLSPPGRQPRGELVHLLIVLGALALAGCSTQGVPLPSANTINIDKGVGVLIQPSGRSILSTWHAGPLREEQVVCVEPHLALGPDSWLRYEVCLEYANGLIDSGTYKDRLSQGRAADRASAARNKPPAEDDRKK